MNEKNDRDDSDKKSLSDTGEIFDSVFSKAISDEGDKHEAEGEDPDQESFYDSAEIYYNIIRKESVREKSKSTWRILENESKIRRLINHLIFKQVEIQIRLKGEKTAFISKFLKVEYEDISPEVGNERVLIIEKLFPEKGNALIQAFPEVDIEFLMNQSLCRFGLTYIGISSIPPYYGYILSFPETVEIEEKRTVERATYELPEVISVEFKLGEESKKDKLYELNVLDCSKYGLGLIITKEDFDLLKKLHKGEKLENISLFGWSSFIKVNGTVRHITKIEYGNYKGCYILGINSPDIIVNCEIVNK